ncbi:ATP-binding protein [Pseudonocardia dioxanivorans]|uniref:ATP-binding protein n=1 Tax=Pseudonocardia dioxanivorans TaxID=240495 RepID=UPI000CD08E77|nr:ATP-binding protein [Pseudonocardia dioxanivorans]
MTPKVVVEKDAAADVEATAYFVVCEALTNVVKHAGAAGADVELSAVDGRPTVSVRDDGCGTTTSGNGRQRQSRCGHAGVRGAACRRYRWLSCCAW